MILTQLQSLACISRFLKMIPTFDSLQRPLCNCVAQSIVLRIPSMMLLAGDTRHVPRCTFLRTAIKLP
jgi:hypothetical protein